MFYSLSLASLLTWKIKSVYRGKYDEYDNACSLFIGGRTGVASKDQCNQGKRENFLLENASLCIKKV